MSAGTSDRATNDEIATATVSTSPNSRKSRPEVPGRKAIGTKTATRTIVVAMTAKNTDCVPSTEEALVPSPRCCRRWMLSRTTMASSTISPVANTSASSVRILIEKPSTQLAASVPSREIGIATAGTKVNRQLPENSRMVRMTMSTEKPSVLSTSVTAPLIKTASSEITCSLMSSRCALKRATALWAPSEIWMVFEPA